MIPWTPKDRRLLWLLCASGVVGAALELVLVREVAVATSTVRTSAFVVFAFLHLFFGLGCWLSERQERPSPQWTLVVCGVTAALALGGTLLMRPGDGVSIAAGLAAICACFTATGLLYGQLLLHLIRDAGRPPGLVVAASGGALLIGLLGSGPLVGWLGANAACALLAVAYVLLALSPTPWAVLAVGLLAGAMVPLAVDSRLEDVRLGRIDPDSQARGAFSVHSAWSPYSRVDLYWYPGRQILRGYYDHRQFWGWEAELFPGEQVPFAFVKDDDRVLIIGASAGKEVGRLPSSRVSTPANTTLVEIDPEVVGFLQAHPEYNGGVFERTRVIAGDGRAVLDRDPGPWDVISIGTLKSSAQSVWQLAELRNGLLTREALERALVLLEEDGVLVVYQDRRWLIERVAAGLDSLEVPWRAVSSKHFQPPGRARKKLLFASRDPGRLDDVEESFLSRGHRVQHLDLAPAPPLTDDRPVGAPSQAQEQGVQRALGLALVVLLCLAGALGLVGGGPRGWRTTTTFVAIGHGFLGVQLYAVARFRDLFHSPIQTLAVVTVCFLGGAVLGHLATLRLAQTPAQRWRWRGLLIVALAFGWLHLATGALPFHDGRVWVRVAATVGTLVPPGVLCGLYFPLALGRTPPEELRLALLADGLGTCVAFVGFFAATWAWGASVALIPVALGYGAATWLLTEGGASGSALGVVPLLPAGPEGDLEGGEQAVAVHVEVPEGRAAPRQLFGREPLVPVPVVALDETAAGQP